MHTKKNVDCKTWIYSQLQCSHIYQIFLANLIYATLFCGDLYRHIRVFIEAKRIYIFLLCLEKIYKNLGGRLELLTSIFDFFFLVFYEAKNDFWKQTYFAINSVLHRKHILEAL